MGRISHMQRVMTEHTTHSRPFIKMHGAGNDFAVFDVRRDPWAPSDGYVRALGHRQQGIGFDQLILIELSDRADIFMRILNADGGEVAACGNATRCIARQIMEETGRDHVSIETAAGLLRAEAAGAQVAVDMGVPKLDWADIPLAQPMDTECLAYAKGSLKAPGAVNMGNPHLVFFVEDASMVPLDQLGPAIEIDPLFPERINVSVLQVDARDHAVLHVWERGAGLTLACGTAACAALVAAHRRGLMDRKADLALPGGVLRIEWRADGHVWMTGPVATAYHGRVDVA